MSQVSDTSISTSDTSRIQLLRDKDVFIWTHDGKFHCDDVTAVMLILKMFPNARVLRTRDAAIGSKAQFVVDVGRKYEPETGRFDHHMSVDGQTWTGRVGTDGAYTVDGEPVKMCSCSLVFQHHGVEILAACVPPSMLDEWKTNTTMQKAVMDHLYYGFFRDIDMRDSGHRTALVNFTSLYNKIDRLNVQWNDDRFGDEGVIMDQFWKAVPVAAQEFNDCVESAFRHWWQARAGVLAAYLTRYDTDASGNIVMLKQFMPWQAHVHGVEGMYPPAPGHETLIVVYPDGIMTNEGRLTCVPSDPTTMRPRKLLPKGWAAENYKVVPEQKFVHPELFMAGTLQGVEPALVMARRAIAAFNTDTSAMDCVVDENNGDGNDDDITDESMSE